MAALSQKELGVLRFLAIEMNRHGHPVKAATVAKNMIPKSNAREAKICLDHLEKIRFATSNLDNLRYSVFHITREGLSALEAIESVAELPPSTQQLLNKPEASPTIEPSSSKRTIVQWLLDWTKPEVLAVIIAALIGAGVLIYVSGKS